MPESPVALTVANLLAVCHDQGLDPSTTPLLVVDLAFPIPVGEAHMALLPGGVLGIVLVPSTEEVEV